VNYPTTKDGWASGITDSPNGNASSCFCLMSDGLGEVVGELKKLNKNLNSTKSKEEL